MSKAERKIIILKCSPPEVTRISVFGSNCRPSGRLKVGDKYEAKALRSLALPLGML